MDRDPVGDSSALDQAGKAAAANDPRSMLEHLYSSYFLDGLARGIRQRWRSFSSDDIEFVIAQAVDALYRAVSEGKKILNLAAFLWKVADRKANDFHALRLREKAIDPEELERISDQRISPHTFWDTSSERDVQDDHEHRRAEAIKIARDLLPRLGQQNIQLVFAYLLDALEAGEVDVPNREIASALGLSLETVRTSLSRGFHRLTRIAREERLIDSDARLATLATTAESAEQ